MRSRATDRDDALLRERAEALLESSDAQLRELEPASVRTVVHDLQVQRIELDLQNEELQGAHAELERSRARYAALYHDAPVGYVVLDSAGTIVRTNTTLARLLDRDLEGLKNTAFADLLAPEDRTAFRARYAALFRQPSGKQLQVRMDTPHAFRARLAAVPRHLEDKRELLLTVADITEQVESRERADHVAAVLRGLRRVNRLIATEGDPHRLLQQTCDELVASLGYRSVWAFCFASDGGQESFASSGLSVDADTARRLKQSPCTRQALASTGTVVIADPRRDCPDCDWAPFHESAATFTSRLRHGDRDHGLITVATRPAYADDAEVLQLFEELVEDLATALHRIRLERTTQRHEAELRQTHAIIDGSPAVAFRWGASPGWPVEYVSKGVTSLLGHAPAELTSGEVSYERLIHPDDRARVTREVSEASASDLSHFEHEPYRLIHRDGTIRYVDDRTLVVRGASGEVEHFDGIVLDVTGRVTAERELREEREYLATMLESIGDAVIATDESGQVTAINRAATTLTGWDAAAATGRPLAELLNVVHSETRAAVQLPDLHRLDEHRTITLPHPLTLRSRDGTEHRIAESVSPIVESTGRVRGVVLVLRDVTEQVATSSALRDSEGRFRRILSALPQLVSYVDRDLVYRYANEAYQRQFQVTADELLGQCLEDFIGPKAFAAARPYVERALAGEPVSYTLRLEYPSGARDVFGQLLPDRREDGEVLGYYAVLMDITEIKEAEREKEHLQAQLLQAQKMESIGRLAGGVAHDFNNLLVSMTCNLSLAKAQLDAGEPRALLTEVQRATERATALTKQLLAVSRKQVMKPRTLAPDDLVRDLLPMLERLLGEDLELEVELAAQKAAVKADPGQLEQVLLNLVVNARDAIPEGGKLRIETALEALDTEFCKDRPGLAPGPYLRISVIDWGEGMTPETLERVFEPFFTTKSEGQGTGLGLATVYGIVHQHGGHVQVRSELRRGTTVEVRLPCTREGRDTPVEKTAEPSARGGSETILVVEDNDLVMAAVVRILGRLGYRVLSAASGPEALELVEREDGSIDLLMTDIVMPHMSGTELAARLHLRWPDLAVLYTSGYNREVVTRRGLLEHGQRYLAKPYAPQELARTIRAIFDG